MAVGTGRAARSLPHVSVSKATIAQLRLWSRLLATAAGIAALAAAGQLGVAYGLGLVRFRRPFPDAGVWATQLTWTAWFAALAVLAGAVAGSWTARRLLADHGEQTHRNAATAELGHRIAVALTAGAGAAVSVGLTALPARTAQLPGADPALEAALAAILGLVVGILAAVAALSLRVVAVSVAAVVAVMWLVALVSVAPSLGPSADPPMVRLGVVDLPGMSDSSTVAVLSPPVLALLVGGAVAAAARSRGLPMAHTILAGAAGPALLALPYLIAAPGAGDRAAQAPAYGGALVGVAAGLLAAVVIAVIRLPGDRAAGSSPGVPAVVPPDVTDPGGAAPAGPGAAAPTFPAEPEPAVPTEPPEPDPDHGGRPEAAASGPLSAGTAPPTEPVLEPSAEAPAEVPAEVPEPPEEPEPAVSAEPAEPAAESAGDHADSAGDQAAPAAPPAPSKKGGRRRQKTDEAHVDWVRSLAGEEDDDAPGGEEDGSARRRLRVDKDLFADRDPTVFDAPSLPSTRRPTDGTRSSPG